MPTTPRAFSWTSRIPGWAVRAALAGLALAACMFFAGCSTATSESNLLMFAAHAPLPTIVPRGTELAAAEQAAKLQHGCIAVRGSGSSMEPVYLDGTAVVIRAGGYERLQAGQAVVYLSRRGTTVAHMLVRPTDYGWVAEGLNNDRSDSDLVTADNLVGVITQAFASKTGPLPKAVAARLALADQIRRGGTVASLGL